MQFLNSLANYTNEITFVFVVVIALLSFLDLKSFFIDEGKNHRSFKNDVVTIGILGTFVGIFIGLYQFNVENINDSIPPLLEGMKTAFGTSIAGLFASVMITIVQKYKSSPYAKSGNPMVDELAKMRQSLDETLKHLSEGASKEIIKALEQVIKDFNQNLTEQFGENFKQLNEACLKLVQWQENYKDTIEETETRFKAATGAIAETAQSLANIAARNEEFEEFCNNTALSLNTMNRLLKNNQLIQDQIKIFIEELNTVTVDLKTVPQAFEAVATKMTENNEKMMNALGQTDTQLKDHIKQSSEAVKQLNDGMATATKNLNDSLVSLTNQFGDNYQAFLSEIDKLMQRPNQ